MDFTEIKYTKTNWSNEGSNEECEPISAANLNNIESGISAAVSGVNTLAKKAKKYVDESTLYFQKSITIPSGSYNTPSAICTILDFPEEYNKYVPFVGIETVSRGNAFYSLSPVSFGESFCVYMSATTSGRAAYLEISTNGEVTGYSTEGESHAMTLHILFVPVKTMG